MVRCIEQNGWLDGWIGKIDGWLNGQEKNRWIYFKNGWLVGWMDLKKMYRKNRMAGLTEEEKCGWLVGSGGKMDGWMDSKKGWLDG